jgi:hypothetical protein
MSNTGKFKCVFNDRGVLPKEGEPTYGAKDGKLKVWIIDDVQRPGDDMCQVIVEYDGIDFSMGGFSDTVLPTHKLHVPERVWHLLGDAVSYVAITSVSEEERAEFTQSVFDLALDLPTGSRTTPRDVQEWVRKHVKHPDRYRKDDFFYHGILKSLRGNTVTPLRFTDGDVMYRAHTTFFRGDRVVFEINFSDERRGLEIRNHFAVPFGEDWRPGLEKMLNDHKSVLSQISR